MNMKFNKIAHLLVTLSIVTSFIFASPSTAVKDRLTQIAIDAINTSNQIAFAQAEDAGTPVCCNGYTPDSANGEYCDNTQCLPTPVCCNNYTPKTDMGEYCDDLQCGDDNKGGTPNYVCCDPTAENDASGAVMSGSKGQNGEPFACGASATYCSYKDPDPTPICCDTSKGGKFPPGKNEYCGSPSEDYCSSGPTVCCDGNWTNYVSPSDRPSNAKCDYQPPTCACTEHTDPFITQSRTTTSNCPGDDNQNATTTATSTRTTTLCQVSTAFSVTKSSIDISGNASMIVSIVNEIGSTTPDCSTVVDDPTYLAGRAAADATPDTPLNTPISLDAFSTYTVTSKDYCPNINGVQNSFTECAITASCGDAVLYPTESAPTSNLCRVGTPGEVSTTLASYDWSCSYDTSTASCSVSRTCNGTTCTEQDYCSNISGIQDSNYASNNNMFIDSDSNCWNNVTGACGSAIQVPAPTGGPTSNLCLPNSSVDTTPTLNTSIDPDKWQWTCKNASGNRITPPSFCEATPCVGTQCTQTISSLIKTFRAQPSIVSNTNSFCNLTWESEIDTNKNADVPVVCTLNGLSSYNGNTIYDDNLTGLSVPPGSYTFSCTDNENNTQSKSVKCVIKPDFKEI
jgi:hypothetical protein